ncbi:MAG: hypothetical protein U0354_17760 [Candidatus Sericytochromatia bacterium]
MKKTSLILLLSVFSLNLNVYAQNDKSTKVVKKVEKKEEFNFRKVKWGMNHLQVSASEKEKPSLESDDKVTYKEKMFERDVNINYFFENDKLIKSEYLFDGTLTDKEEYITYFKKIKSNLISKYGKPSSDNSKEVDIMEKSRYSQVGELLSQGVLTYDVIWNKPDTTIKLGIKGKDFFTALKLYIAYNSKKFKEKDDTKEVEKSLF